MRSIENVIFMWSVGNIINNNYVIYNRSYSKYFDINAALYYDILETIFRFYSTTCIVFPEP